MLLSEKKWEEFVEKISGTFRLKDEEKKAFAENRVAKLIAAIPYNAGCDDAERTALSHLGTFMVAKDKYGVSVFAHTADDDSDVLKRIRCISDFAGGDTEIIKRGMNLLALVQLEDHHNDIASDASSGNYNPVASGSWDYDKMKADLAAQIKAVDCPEMDEVMTVENLQGFWDWS